VAARAMTLRASPRPAEADVGGLAFARALDGPELRRAVAQELGPRLEPGEAVGLPAVLGLDRSAEAWTELQDALGAPVFEIPTPPPSVPGMRLYRALTAALRRAGGRLVVGPEAVAGEARGRRLAGVVVREASRTRTHEAEAVVLASGGLASGGLELDSHGALRETVFGLPVVEPSWGAVGGLRLSPRYLDPQPLLSAGLAVDGYGRPIDPDGRPVYENLHAAGDILAGALPWREKSGEGLAIAGGYAAASAILDGA
jgi:glycerol-3-phosphate dehydrogenase subunit B